MPSARARSTAALLLAAALVSACRGSSGGAGDTPVDVHGVVVFDGTPVASVTVGIAGVGTVTTASDGTFTLARVTVPYDVGLAIPSQGRALFYQGLRSTTPKLELLVGPPGPTSSGTVSGTVSGGEGYPQPADHDTLTCLDSSGSVGQPGGAGGGPGGGAPEAYGAGLTWWGTPGVTTRLRGVQRVVDPVSGLPTDYVAYGEVDPLLLTTAGIDGQVLTLDAVSATTLAGTVALPDGYELSHKALQLGCLWLAEDDTTTSAFAYRSPALAGADFAVLVDAGVPGIAVPGTRLASASALRTGLAPDASGVAVTIPAAPQLLDPEDLATGIGPGTAFSWSERAGAVYLVTLRAFGAASPFLLAVITPFSTVSLPDPALVGVAFPQDTVMTWRAGSVSPTSMAAIAEAGRLRPPGDWTEAVSETRFCRSR